MTLRDHPFFQELISLGLPAGDYVIAGSAPMLAHGLKRNIGDIDIVARGAAWKNALELGEVSQSPLGPAKRVVLFAGDIEVLDGWFDYSVDSLIKEGEFVDGFRFLSLARTMEWKNALGRKLDIEDVVLMKRYIDHA